MALAIIPARGGSKRIPRKNVRDFCGKPMIAWTILAAIASELFDAVIVSTDDDEIADVAESYGAEVPFRRPPELSDDHTATMPVIVHAIRWWEEHRQSQDQVCCLYATAPFIRSQDLRMGKTLLDERPSADFAFSITTFAFPIYRSLSRAPDGTVVMNWPENETVRSQDLPEAWHDAGQFYWGRKDAFLTHSTVCSANAVGVPIPRQLVQDIDTDEDWRCAELIHRANATAQ